MALSADIVKACPVSLTDTDYNWYTDHNLITGVFSLELPHSDDSVHVGDLFVTLPQGSDTLLQWLFPHYQEFVLYN